MNKRSRIQWLELSFDNQKSKACPEPRRRIENRKWPGLFAIVVALTACGARAQQPKKVPRIGYLSSGDATSESIRFEGIRLALRERGQIEGQSIASEYRYTEGKPDWLPELAAELVSLKG